jgi:hypothetical protein
MKSLNGVVSVLFMHSATINLSLVRPKVLMRNPTSLMLVIANSPCESNMCRACYPTCCKSFFTLMCVSI